MARLSFSYLAFVAASLASVVSAVHPISVQGSNFINNVTGNRLQIIGVDYQPGGSSGYNADSGVDPLSNSSVCLRDATLMQRLGVNTIRIYNLDPTLDHDECASIFNDAGIYMILDVNSPLPNESLDRTAPWTSYNSIYLNRIFEVIEAFAPYPNTLGFFAGNEVINEQSNVMVPAYLRAVTRDMKDYIANHIGRDVGVGYSAADVRDILADTWNYLGCELANSTSSKIDFFGLNSYSWCGNSSYHESGYDQLVEQFSNTTIPVFFSEYGCNNVKPRVFSEVPVLYGPDMTVLSGGLVYEYSQEVSDYGLVILNDNDTVTLRVDYTNLQEEYSLLNLTLLESANATATSLTAPICEPSMITNATFLNYFSIPSRPPGGDSLVTNGLTNPNRGKLVDVSSFTPSQTIYNVDGSVLSGLKMTQIANNGTNSPGSNNSGSSSGSATTTASASGTSSTSKSSASAKASNAAVSSKSLSQGAIVLAGAAVIGMVMA